MTQDNGTKPRKEQDKPTSEHGISQGAGKGNEQQSYDQGGNEGASRQSGQGSQQEGNRGAQGEPDATGAAAEIQQSAQREGMGHHRRSGRDNAQDLDADRKVDDMGTRQGSSE